MKTNRLFLLSVVIVLLVGGCGGKSGLRTGLTGGAAAPTPAVPARPSMPYADLAKSFTHPDTTLTSVTLVRAGEVKRPGISEPMPEHCVVKGRMNDRTSPVDGKKYAIGFEMRLPTNWNGRFFYQANGGLDGMVVDAFGDIQGGGPVSNGLLKGFAVISSDAGHEMEKSPIGGGVFGIDPQARIDYGYNAVARLTPMAKQLIRVYYGKGPDKSYMVGGSNGGRHGMVAASRYADQYDGILAVAPGFNLPKAAVAQLWGAQQLATISKPNPQTGRPDVSTSFSAADLQLVSQKILAACDGLDGLADGIVSDVKACQMRFSPDRDLPTCAGAPEGTCLTSLQKSVLTALHAGARNRKGEAVYTGFPWDPGISSATWRAWKYENSTGPRDPLAVGFVFATPPVSPKVLNGTGTTVLDYALNYQGDGFDVDRDGPKIYATNETYRESAVSFMTPPDPTGLPKFVANHRKMIVVHGAADPVFSVNDTIGWYERFSKKYGKSSSDTVRLFIVPGMSHSRGGPATDQFDMVDALVNWVERGVAPDAVVAKARGKGSAVPNPEVPQSWSPDRTRPLCAYPEVARYKGNGSVEAAASFSCAVP